MLKKKDGEKMKERKECVMRWERWTYLRVHEMAGDDVYACNSWSALRTQPVRFMGAWAMAPHHQYSAVAAKRGYDQWVCPSGLRGGFEFLFSRSPTLL